MPACIHATQGRTGVAGTLIFFFFFMVSNWVVGCASSWPIKLFNLQCKCSIWDIYSLPYSILIFFFFFSVAFQSKTPKFSHALLHEENKKGRKTNRKSAAGPSQNFSVPIYIENKRKSVLWLWFANLKMKIYYKKFKKNYIINSKFKIIILKILQVLVKFKILINHDKIMKMNIWFFKILKIIT